MIDAFKRLEIELVDLRLEGIDTTPDYRERPFWLSRLKEIAHEKRLKLDRVTVTIESGIPLLHPCCQKYKWSSDKLRSI